MRYWKIVNPGVKNHVGQPTAYKLEVIHRHSVRPAGQLSGRRAGYVEPCMGHRFRIEERYPAGSI